VGNPTLKTVCVLETKLFVAGDILQSFLCELDDSDPEEESRQTSSSQSQKMEMEELD